MSVEPEYRTPEGGLVNPRPGRQPAARPAKSTLIQHSEPPTETTGLETPVEQVVSSVHADLFSWNPLEGVESALTRSNIDSFNKVRMNGRLYAPTVPLDYINSLGSIAAIPTTYGIRKVQKAIAEEKSNALAAENLRFSKKYVSLSQIVEEKDPYGFPGRRQTPFQPIYSLQSRLEPDNSANGYPAGFNNFIGLRDDEDELRDPEVPGINPVSYQPPVQQLVTVNTVGHNWLY